MITIDVTMFIQIVNIFILIVILNIVLYRPIRSILAERKRVFAGLSRDIETFHKNAEMRLEEFEAKIAEARVSAKAKIDEARAEGQAAAGEKVGAVRSEVEADKAAKLEALEKDRAAVAAELSGQVEDFAREMAAKVLGRAV